MFKTITRCPMCGHSKATKDRSNEQNRYYWGVVIDLISEHTGFNREEMHEVLKHKFLRQTVWVPLRNGIKEQSIITKSTTKLTTLQFEEYLREIRQWAAEEMSISLPEPNEKLNNV